MASTTRFYTSEADGFSVVMTVVKQEVGARDALIRTEQAPSENISGGAFGYLELRLSTTYTTSDYGELQIRGQSSGIVF